MFDDILNSKFLNLNNIYRFSNTKLIERESTASHTMSMQLIALYFYNKYPQIDIDDICMRILYHDLDECVCADIPRNMKYYSKESLSIINEATQSMLNDSGIREEIIDKINHAKHDGTWEGWFVQVLDVLQCVYKLYDEYNLQHSSIIYDRLSESIDTYLAVINKADTEFKYSDNDYRLEIEHELNDIWKDIFNRIPESYNK